MKLYQLPLLMLPTALYARDYHFESYVSSMFLSGTVDEIFFRLCNEDDECGLFTEVPAGWQSPGQSYTYTYSTKQDLGDIYKVQIVHPGSDQLCIGHVMVDHVEYDENEHRWIDWPHCIEETDGGGCDTVTIILPENDWNSALTIPCEFDKKELHGTHAPTSGPSAGPTAEPTPSPSPMPTPLPSTTPTAAPSVEPTIEPTTGSPTILMTTTSTTETTLNIALVGSQVVDNGNSHILVTILATAGTFVFCLCLTLLLVGYCWRRRRMERGMKVMQCASSEFEEGATLRETDTMDTGSSATNSNKGSYDEIGSTPCSAAFDEGDDDVVVVVDNEILLEDDLSSEDEGIYINGQGNTSRRDTLDLSRSLDEDVLPMEQDEEEERDLAYLE